jgi:predicted dehydrogenase
MTATLARSTYIPVERRSIPRLRVGILGYGYWGPNLARNVAQDPECTLMAIADINPKRLATARLAHPLAQLTTDFREVLNDPEVEAVFIATPPETHHDVVVAALEAGKHVLVEKPLATNVADAAHMMAVAKRCGRLLAVDHTFLFTGAVRRMKRYCREGEVGEVYYYDSTRINLGLFNHETNVIWDLAPHDISIMHYLLGEPVKAVSAIGARHVDTNVENIAYLTLQFQGPMLAHFHVNWLAPVKVRRTIIGGSRKMLVYDDGETDEKLKVYDSGAQLCATREDIYRTLVEYRTGDVVSPKLEKSEALAVETRNFVRAVRGEEALVSDASLGLEVVRIIAAAQESLRRGGVAVEVER